MERRQAVMSAAGVTRWDLLPEGADSEGVCRFPLLLVVIDEAADFAKSPVMGDLIELARKGRASGVSLILATQRPDSEVLSRQVKANVGTRVAFRTVDGVESRVILDRGGAESLRRVGLCLTNAGGQWRKVQAAYIPDDALGEWVQVRGEPGPVLDDTEAALVRFALDELGGAFTIGALYEAFRGEVSKYGLEQLAQRWELRGWLTEPGHDDNGYKVGRLVTDDLAALALSDHITAHDTSEGAITRPVILDTMTRRGELPPFLAQRYGHNGNAPNK
jgi:DNA segregation ATPase FtsK/SpoIIIE-like protein